MMSPGIMAGMKLWKRWRSDPQIAQLVTLTIASRGCSISGSVTVSQRMSSLPCQTNALIATLAKAVSGILAFGKRSRECGGTADFVRKPTLELPAHGIYRRL